MSRRLISALAAFAVIFFAPLPSQAQRQSVLNDQDFPAAKVYFRQGVSELELNYGDNAASLDSIVRGVNRMLADPELIFQALVVETGASPEGSYEINEELAMSRARNIRNYLLNHLALSSSQVKAFSVGIDWEGLYELLRLSDSQWRDEAMSVIADCGVRMNSDRAPSERCISRLLSIDGGKAWEWMMSDLFPALRQGTGDIRCVAYREPKTVVLPSVRDTIVIVHEYEGTGGLDAAAVNAIIDSRVKKRVFRSDSLFKVPTLAVRTNLLLPLMNIGVEVPINNRLSISADVYGPWMPRAWSDRIFEPGSHCFQLFDAMLDVRYWLGKNHSIKEGNKKYRLRGHSIGLVATGGLFDFEKNYEGNQGEYLGVGLGYMYSLPLGKKGNIHLEFEVAGGYCYIQERPYSVIPGTKQAISHEVENYHGKFLPLKACVSLVLPITIEK